MQRNAISFLPDKIERWPIGRLRPFERNPRTHSEDQIAALARSIREFGWTLPLLIDETGEIIAGHGRLLAAVHLGLAEIPVIILSHLTEAQKRAYLLADNKLTERGGWNEALLATVLDDLHLEDFDLTLTGFEPGELADLIDLPDPGDGYEGDGGGKGEEPQEANVRAVIGTYRFTVPRGAFLQWQEDLRAQAGFEEESILAELKTRLGFE